MGKIRWRVVGQGDNEIVEEIHKLAVHRINMGDVEDPDLMVAQPLWEWQQSPQGKFIMDHAIEKPSWQRMMSPSYMGWSYVVIAELEKKRLTEYYLKFGNFIKDTYDQSI